MISFRLFKFAIFIKVLIIFLQLIFNLLVPDHDADAFRLPHDPENGSANKIVFKSLSGLSRWDAQYFLHIALYGYTHENTLAFFPVFPLLLKITKNFIHYLLSSILSELNCALIAGVVLNSIASSLAGIFLYKLSVTMFHSEIFATVSFLLFCLNPASIFFSAVYSEALFSFFTFSGLWAAECGKHWIALCLLAISAAVRSNGILSVGFLIYALFKEYIKKRYQIFSFSTTSQFFLILKTSVKITIYSLLFFIPFGMYQVYCYILYCTSLLPEMDIPEVVIDYITRNDLKLPSDPSKWCFRHIPLAYTYVQARYWEVGFLQYFTIKQIPNFLLAAPIALLIVLSSLKYLRRNQRSLWHAGLLTYQYDNLSDIYNCCRCFPYFIHAVAVTAFCSLFIHVQVMTRILCSSSPVLYWIASAALLPYDDRSKSSLMKEYSHNSFLTNYIGLLKKLFFKCPPYGKVIFCYFLTYFSVGIFLHVNFLPWT